MSLPELIEELFSALYESQNGIFGDKAEAQARYEAILKQAITQYGCTRGALLKFLSGGYGRWVRENKLPEPPKE